MIQATVSFYYFGIYNCQIFLDYKTAYFYDSVTVNVFVYGKQ